MSRISRSVALNSSAIANRDEEEALVVPGDGIERTNLPASGSASSNRWQQQQHHSLQHISSMVFAVVAGIITCPIWAFCIVLWWIKERIFQSNPNNEQMEAAGRVKAIDCYNAPGNDERSLVLLAMFTGHVMVWNRNAEERPKKTLHVSDACVRSIKYLKRSNSIVAASDDMKIRLYHADTLARVTAIDEAHTDYIRSLDVHPTLPYLFSSSDDMTIKCWDMEYNYSCKYVMEGHYHYVMQIKVNPHDTTMLASASLDRTINVWKLGQETPLFSLKGHSLGVNCLDFCSAAAATTTINNSNVYLASGSDDNMVKIWDLETKAVIHTLEGHTDNITAVLFHPVLPLLVSASEDGTCRFWDNSNKFEPILTLDLEMGRCWTLSAGDEDREVVMGYDQGCVCVNLVFEASLTGARLQLTNKRVLNLGKDKAENEDMSPA